MFSQHITDPRNNSPADPFATIWHFQDYVTKNKLGRHDFNTEMHVNGRKCTLHMPKVVDRVRDALGNEVASGLPPYAPRAAFAVDEYPACPKEWMHGSAKASSYFVPILPEHGMWLDFNGNTHHTHDIAVVPSIQGVNPLTGVKTDPIRLEQYKAKCPKHDIDFQMDLHCPECKYNWHPQNYLSTNNGSPFWIDGFRTEEGVIRQWYFTEEECKGVAAQIIGKDRVFAIGAVFYDSKQPRPKPVYQYQTFGAFSAMPAAGTYCSVGGSQPLGDLYSTQQLGSFEVEFSSTLDCNVAEPLKQMSSKATCNTAGLGAAQSLPARRRRTRGGSMQRMLSAAPEETIEPVSITKQLEIGAGAMIHQQINRDPQNLEYWQEEPSGFLYINYCDVETACRIIAAGKRQAKADGFLAGLNIKD